MLQATSWRRSTSPNAKLHTEANPARKEHVHAYGNHNETTRSRLESHKTYEGSCHLRRITWESSKPGTPAYRSIPGKQRRQKPLNTRKAASPESPAYQESSVARNPCIPGKQHRPLHSPKKSRANRSSDFACTLLMDAS